MTKIEWTEATWNPMVGCSIVSPGCTNCYAMKMAARLEAMAQAHCAKRENAKADLGPLAHYLNTTQRSKAGPVWTGRVALAPERTLLEPLRRKTPTMYFVNSMSDLFHESVPDEWIDRVFAVMALCPQHTFQVLTKRSKRMREYMAAVIPVYFGTGSSTQRAPHDASAAGDRITVVALRLSSNGVSVTNEMHRRRILAGIHNDFGQVRWPLPNVWLGVSAERQKEANERIPDLLATPAAVRFVSAEPLLGPIDFTRIRSAGDNVNALRHVQRLVAHNVKLTTPRGERRLPPGEMELRRPSLDWIIVGGESGPGARPMVLGWAKDIVRQCRDASVAVFVKQVGAYPTNREGERCPHITARKGDDMAEWPEELRVREWPQQVREVAA